MQTLKVELRRKDCSAPWGFRIGGGADLGIPLQIDRVTPGTLADRCGLLTGDMITNIGGDNAVSMTHIQAKQAIIRCGNEMDMTVARNPNQQRKGPTVIEAPPAPVAPKPSNPNISVLQQQRAWSPSVHSPAVEQNGQQGTMSIDRRRSRKNSKNYVTSAKVMVSVGQSGTQPEYRAPEERQQGPALYVAPGPTQYQGAPSWNTGPSYQNAISPLSTPVSASRDQPQFYSQLSPVPRNQPQRAYQPQPAYSAPLQYQPQPAYSAPAQQLSPQARAYQAAPSARYPQQQQQQQYENVFQPEPAYQVFGGSNLKVQKPAPVQSKHFNDITPAGYGAAGNRQGVGAQAPTRKPSGGAANRRAARVASRGSAVFQQAKMGTPNCSICNTCIRGPFVSALEKCFCPPHFICSHCGRNLVDSGFAELENGQLVCERDYADHHAPYCHACGEKILETAVKALDSLWHTKCFTCVHCSRPLNIEGFHLEDGRPYCTRDYNELFQVKCDVCFNPILAGDRLIEAIKKRFHSECFRCTKCNCTLEGKQFCSAEGRPFCVSHAPKRFM